MANIATDPYQRLAQTVFFMLNTTIGLEIRKTLAQQDRAARRFGKSLKDKKPVVRYIHRSGKGRVTVTITHNGEPRRISSIKTNADPSVPQTAVRVFHELLDERLIPCR